MYESIVGALRLFRWKAFYLRMLMLQWWVWSSDVIMCAVPFDDLIWHAELLPLWSPYKSWPSRYRSNDSSPCSWLLTWDRSYGPRASQSHLRARLVSPGYADAPVDAATGAAKCLLPQMGMIYSEFHLQRHAKSPISPFACTGFGECFRFLTISHEWAVACVRATSVFLFVHHVQQGFSCDAAWTEAELWEVWHWDALSPETESSVVVASSVPCHDLMQLLTLQSSSPRRVQRLWSWDWRPSTERWKIQYDRRKYWSQTSDNMDRWKQSRAEAARRERLEERTVEEKESEERRCRCAKR